MSNELLMSMRNFFKDGAVLANWLGQANSETDSTLPCPKGKLEFKFLSRLELVCSLRWGHFFKDTIETVINYIRIRDFTKSFGQHLSNRCDLFSVAVLKLKSYIKLKLSLVCFSLYFFFTF